MEAKDHSSNRDLGLGWSSSFYTVPLVPPPHQDADQTTKVVTSCLQWLQVAFQGTMATSQEKVEASD